MELASMYLRVLKVEGRDQHTALREIRKSSGYSAKFVSDALKISPSTLYKYERNPASVYVSTAVKFARVYGVPIDDLSFS